MIFFGFSVGLGPIDRSHLPLLRSWRNDYRIWKTCRQNRLISDIDQEKWYIDQSTDESVRMFVIYVSDRSDLDGKAIGVCGLTDIDLINRRAEFSCYIAPAYQGQGYASGALKTLFNYGFMMLGLNLIWGETFEGNGAELLFQRLGMIQDGTRREFYYREGRFIDAHLYSIRAEDWTWLPSYQSGLVSDLSV